MDNDQKNEKVKGTIFSMQQSGLGNRIKCLVSVMRLSRNPKVLWKLRQEESERLKICGWPQCKFSDLFLNDYEVKRVARNGKKYLSARFYVYPNELPKGFSSVIKPCGSKMTNSIDFEYNRIPQEIIDCYVKEFSRLVFISEITERFEETKENINAFDQKLVSIQVRTWSDKTTKNEDRKKTHPFVPEEYFKHMDSFDSDTGFFVSTDDISVIDLFKERYGKNKIHSLKRKEDIMSYGSPYRTKEDMIETLLLGNNDRMICSFFSSFPEIAWWFGGAKAEVTVL